MIYDISIDPGLNATGMCLWYQGVPQPLITIRPSPKCKTAFHKLLDLKVSLRTLCCEICDKDRIGRVAIEEWRKGMHRGKFSVDTMRVCAEVRGMIIATMEDYAATVMEASKGTLPKAQTELRARAAGLIVLGKRKPSKDALDAYEIGIAAGFDRRGT